MRPFLLLSAVVCLSSCGDDIIGPNTDVGLSVWTEVRPNLISIRDTATVLHMRVYVGNTTDHEIRVVSGGPPYVFTAGEPIPHSGLWGSLRIANDSDSLRAGPSIDWWGDSVYVFPAREAAYNEETMTLHQWNAGGYPLTTGIYTARGWFNGREGKSSPFYIVP